MHGVVVSVDVDENVIVVVVVGVDDVVGSGVVVVGPGVFVVDCVVVVGVGVDDVVGSGVVGSVHSSTQI